MTYAAAGGPMVNFYYKDSADLPVDKRYGFKGWSTSKFEVDKGKNIEFVNLDTFIITKAMNLYPYYETEDVYTVPSNAEYFKINGNTIFFPTAGFQSGANVVLEYLGGYWSSSLNIEKQSCAYGLYLNTNDNAVGKYSNSNRKNGFLVRPILDNKLVKD
jgi:hypothetical protein